MRSKNEATHKFKLSKKLKPGVIIKINSSEIKEIIIKINKS